MRPAGIRSLVVVLGLSLGIMAGPTLEVDNASAQSNQARGLELLSRATKSYEAGAYSDAADNIDSAFKAGLTGELAARAILLRAEINERSGSLAKAFQDYSNALWMETLPPAERKRASEGKDRVMAAMGLSPPGSSGASSQANTPVGTTSAAGAQSGSSSSGVLGFFSGVFGGSESTPAPPRPPETQQVSQPSAPASSQPTPAPTQRQNTPSQAAAKPAKVAHAKPAPAAAQAPAQPASALSVASAPGGVLIVFGSASSEASGRATAKNIKAQLADILINRQLDVTPRANGGFQIQAGPYPAKSSALALCSAIKQRGVQCQVTP